MTITAFCTTVWYIRRFNLWNSRLTYLRSQCSRYNGGNLRNACDRRESFRASLHPCSAVHPKGHKRPRGIFNPQDIRACTLKGHRDPHVRAPRHCGFVLSQIETRSRCKSSVVSKIILQLQELYPGMNHLSI